MTFVALLTLAPLVAFLLILIAPESQSRAAALVLSLVIFAASLGLLQLAPDESANAERRSAAETSGR